MNDNILEWIEFRRRLFYPTIEEILACQKVMDRINEDINIIEETEDGCIVEIKSLDLSFLDKDI